jgi:hypothetical protein
MFSPNSLRRILVVFTLLTCAIGAHAAVSPVTIRVEAVSSTDPEKFTTVQKRSLKVYLTNGSGQDITGMKLKYYYFTKDVKDREVVVKEDGEKAADVKARTTEIIETPVIRASSTEAHSTGGNKGNRNKQNQSKKVPAGGERIVGHGAQLFSSDGKLMTEYFSEPSLKTLVGGGSR